MNTSQKFFFVLRFSFPMHFGGKCGLNTMNITVHLKMGAFGPLCPNYIRHLDSEMKHEKQILVFFSYHWCNGQRHLKFLQNFSKLKGSIGNYINMHEF